MTPEGYERFRKEVDELKNVKRKEIAVRIQEAKELGDLSENAEYQEAKNEQAFIEGRIIELDILLKNATIIEEKKQSNTVEVGSTIKTRCDGTICQYMIVGSNEADPTQGRISNESPLGQAFLGKHAGDVFEVKLPKGTRQFEIISIQ